MLRRPPGNDFLRLLLLAGDNAGDAGFQDTRFLGGDFLQAVAQVLLVIHRDGGEHRQRRMFDQICRVQPSAKARFQQQDIGRVAGKGQECRRRGDLEKGDGVAVIGRIAFLQHGCQFHIRDQFSGQPDPLVEAN